MVETGTTMILVISTKQIIYSHHENPHNIIFLLLLFWRRLSVWIYGVRNTNSNIHLTWIVLKSNVMKMMHIINIQFNIIIIDCKRGYHWNFVTSRKPMSTSALPRSTLVFEGWKFPMLSSRAVNIYIIVNHRFLLGSCIFLYQTHSKPIWHLISVMKVFVKL